MPETLSATEQSIFNSSVASNTTLPPDKSSNELPAGIVTSLTKKASGKQKLKDLGLDDDEIQALIGV